jgi:hypothetical protein
VNDAKNLKDRVAGAVSSASDDVVAAVNGDLAFSNFSNSARFYTSIILDSEIPKGTERDNRLLKKQQQTILDTSKVIAASCASEVVLPKGTIAGIDGDMTLKDAVTLIERNHVRLVNFFRASALSDDTTADFSEPFVLTGDETKFRAAVKANYGEKAANDCRMQGSFFENISSAMGRIGNLGGKIGEAIKDWEDAWAMLNNAKDNGKTNTLRLSLDVSGEGGAGFSVGADLAGDNAKKYNSPPPALGIGAQLRSIGQKIVDSLEVMAPQYDKTEKALKDAKHTEEIPPLLEKARNERQFDADIAADYTTLRTLIGESNQTTQKNLAELVRMHATLVDIADSIGKAIPISEKACNDQDKGSGQCKY